MLEDVGKVLYCMGRYVLIYIRWEFTLKLYISVMCRQRNGRENGILRNPCEPVVLLVLRDAHQLPRSVDASHERGGNVCSHPFAGRLHCRCVYWTVLDNWHLLHDLSGGRPSFLPTFCIKRSSLARSQWIDHSVPRLKYHPQSQQAGVILMWKS